jgi:UDP-N-acetylmuramyl pentapeptide phosphotransferase/UDP-N-acetylglucosamine-1-phosphate transferase
MNLIYAPQIAWFAFLGLALSYLGIVPLRRWAERRQILDIPNKRSSHTRPVPRAGGLAIVFLSLVGLIAAWLLNPAWSLSILLTFLMGAALIATVSWIDDLRPLPNRIRFAAHSAGAILAISGFGYWRSIDIPLVSEFHMGWFGFLITFLWIVGLTNAYNFMDGIDGIAGGQAVVAGAGWTVLGLLNDQPLVAILGLLAATTSLGFLGHNWPPARIFMGDVGSAFLGYTFAILPVTAIQNDPRFALIGLLLVWPFVFDTIFTFLRRLRKGENVFSAHRSHLYQRLVIAGYSHRFVTLLYIGLAFVGLVLSVFWYQRGGESSLLIVVTLPLLCTGLLALMSYQERRYITRS